MTRRIEKLSRDLTEIKEWVTAVDKFLNNVKLQIGDLMAQVNPDWIRESSAAQVSAMNSQRRFR